MCVRVYAYMHICMYACMYVFMYVYLFSHEKFRSVMTPMVTVVLGMILMKHS